MTGRAVAAVLTALLTVGLAGCGEQKRADISPQAAQVLASDVDAITAAARAKDATQVQQALQALRSHVDAHQASGDLSSERASRILAAAAKVGLDVGLPAPKVIVSPVPAPPARRQEPQKGESKDDKDKEEKDEDDEDEDD